MKIIVCHLIDNASGSGAIGAGRTQEEALQDAITHHSQPADIVRRRIKQRTIATAFHGRGVALPFMRAR